MPNPSSPNVQENETTILVFRSVALLSIDIGAFASAKPAKEAPVRSMSCERRVGTMRGRTKA